MPRRRPPSEDLLQERRRALHEDVERGGLPVPLAIRRMREGLGLTQAAFAKAFGLTERQVWEIEKGRGNPTLDTLSRLTGPYGFRIGVILRAAESPIGARPPAPEKAVAPAARRPRRAGSA
jgi:transcriptional regulator with XRE-family HTH domain